ncbi:MAG TPA: hypothetical protein PKG63_09295 [Bacteroidales bacterium]|jgi:hypothetical protein|nr:hypothetical protein [Bacteroidales bacterium]
MSHLKPQLFQKIYNDSLSQYRLAILPIVKNKDNTGVYAFTESSAHRTYYNIFMFNGKDIVFSNIEQDVALLKFLENYSFSKCKQKLLIKRIQKIKQHNQEIHDSQIF